MSEMTATKKEMLACTKLMTASKSRAMTSLSLTVAFASEMMPSGKLTAWIMGFVIATLRLMTAVMNLIPASMRFAIRRRSRSERQEYLVPPLTHPAGGATRRVSVARSGCQLRGGRSW